MIAGVNFREIETWAGDLFFRWY